MAPKWLGILGLDPVGSPHVSGLAPYATAVVQFNLGPQYVSAGSLGSSAKLQPGLSVPDIDRYTDIGIDGT